MQQLEEVDTRYVDSRNLPNGLFRMELESTAFFKAGASDVPSLSELELLLTLAFSGENLQTYINILRQLPGDNIFSTTVDVTDSQVREEQTNPGSTGSRSSRDSGSAKTSKVAIGSSVAAGTFLALLAGMSIYRRRGHSDGDDKADMVAGHATVAGETYMYSSSEVESELHRTRFLDDNHSEWAISTKAHTEAGSSDDASIHSTVGPLERQINEFGGYSNDPLSQPGFGHPRRTEAGYCDPLPQPSYCDPLAQATFDQCDSLTDFSASSQGMYRPLEGGRDVMGDPPAAEEEDDDVPMRVVDLIKKFSPGGFGL